MIPPGSVAGYGAIAVISPLDQPTGEVACRSLDAHPVAITKTAAAEVGRAISRDWRVDRRITDTAATQAPRRPSENRRRIVDSPLLAGEPTVLSCVRATRVWSARNARSAAPHE